MKSLGLLTSVVLLASATAIGGDQPVPPLTTLAFHVDQPVRDKAKAQEKKDGDQVCYTMHSLLVSREGSSDATRIVGERTCTASKEFQTKSTSPKK